VPRLERTSGNPHALTAASRGRTRLRALTVLVAVLAAPAAVHAEPLQFKELAAQCAPWIHPTTLSAVVLQESRANPLAIGVNGSYKLKRQPRDKAEAVATARWLADNGHNFDAGLGQINVRNMRWLGLGYADLFDPCANLRGAGLVLSDCYSRASRSYGAGQKALMAALSCYNTGDFGRGLRNGYVGKVASKVGVAVPELKGASSQPPAAPAPPPSSEASGREDQQVQSTRPRSKDVFAEENDAAPEQSHVTKSVDLQESRQGPVG
jgi:type IV secretion system protein VirB1